MQKNRRGHARNMQIAVFAVIAIAGTAYWFHRTPKRSTVILVSADTTHADQPTIVFTGGVTKPS